jgi:hypothetical protein
MQGFNWNSEHENINLTLGIIEENLDKQKRNGFNFKDRMTASIPNILWWGQYFYCVKN